MMASREPDPTPDITVADRLRGLSMRSERPLRFLLAGGFNTLVGLTFYPLLLWAFPVLHTRYLVALAIAQPVCLCIAFATYKLGVFRTRGGLIREFGVFAGFYLINYAANWIALPLLVEVARIAPVIAQTVFTVVLIAGSWFWHTRLTFRSAMGGR